MTKMGYYFNQEDCVGCKACQVACKDKNALPLGVLFRNVRDFEVGVYPDARMYHLSSTCNHCANPACVAACPSGAMYVDSDDGTVQHNDDMCIGCQYCVGACPYGNPKYIERLGVVHKCDACIMLRVAGEKPACVATCPVRALDFGPYDELRAAHPNAVDKIAVLPDPSMTSPCTIIDSKPCALTEDPAPVELFL